MNCHAMGHVMKDTLILGKHTLVGPVALQSPCRDDRLNY